MVTDKEREVTLVDILRPVIRLNQILGICPHDIQGENLIFRWTSSHFFHTIFTLTILCLYFLYILFQFTHSLMGTNAKRLNVMELVNILCWANGTFIPMTMISITIRKRDQFTRFFHKMGQYKEPLKDVIDCNRTLKDSRRFYVLYILLTLASLLFVASDTVRTPQEDFSLLFYFDDPSMTLIILNTIWQCYLVLIKSGASAFIEVLCCSLAMSFVSCLKKIQQEMRETIERRESDLSLNTRVQSNALVSSIGSPIKWHRLQPSHVFQRELLNQVTYPQLPTTYSTKCPQSMIMDNNNLMMEERGSRDGALPLLLAVKLFHCVASMQRLINCIFGPILALNTALLVFMCCVLLFLQIKYFGVDNLDTYDGLIVSGRTLIFFIRLVLIFISLGNLHEASMAFNGSLSLSLIQVKKPKASEINLILAHLTTNMANPVCFSAGGFFIFSRGSLLAVFSIITTYLVFLLQAGSDDSNSTLKYDKFNCSHGANILI